MASTRDAQDILGIGGGPVKHANKKKKKKIIETQPRLTGISREVQALMGDSVPPVQILDAPKYKSKPSLAAKLYRARHWDARVFTPGARKDGLHLSHWKRALPLQRPANTNGDTLMENGEKENSKLEYQFEEEFPMEKWDIHVTVPQYTDEQYEKHYQTDDWTREETDYLMRLISDYDLRWILVADRYDPLEIPPATAIDTGENTEIAKQYPPRTVEQMKSRFYSIAAQDLELRTPKSTMNPTEFTLWERMRNFDAKTETLRKNTAEKLFERTKDEAEEERTLLEELNRITKNEDEFISMRRDLYARLESAPSLRRNERGEEQNIVLSSAGLSDLLSRLFAKEKHLKRRLPAPAEGNAQAQQGQPEGRVRSNTQISRRDTMDTPTENKKASVALPVPKTLTKAEEEKYGVSHPTERLTSGVSFRHEKINRITTAKSQVQTQKVTAALNELQIPARLSMPTEKVCKEFERLVGQLQLLLDARKTLTRVSEEVKTLEEVRRQRLGEPASTEEQRQGDSTNADQSAASANGVNSHTESSTQNISASQPAEDDEDEGPGPAIDEDDDAEAEDDDDVDASRIDRTEIEDDEDLEDTQNNETQQDVDDEDDNEDEDEDQEDDDDENDDEDDDDEGMQALRRGAVNESDDDSDAEAKNPEPLVEEGDSEEEDEESDGENADQDEDETQDVTMNEVESAKGDPDIDDPPIEESRPTSAGSRAHKRGASVISDASGAGSNRSGLGRKRKR